MRTGENERGIHQILDMTRAIAIILLLLHFYFYGYTAFRIWKLTAGLSDRILENITRTGLFNHFLTSKGMALGFLAISLLGARGRKSQAIRVKTAITYIGTGLLLYFASFIFFYVIDNPVSLACIYMFVTGFGFILILTGGNYLSRILYHKVSNDIFNRTSENFPQEERKLENAYSINLPARYNWKGKVRNSWINIVNPFRGLLIMGSPGSGKTYFIVQHIIKQQMEKGFSMLVYDFKYPDLSRIAYNHFLKNKKKYPGTPAFYNINFDDLSRTHRSNPLAASTLIDITDAAESARTIMLGLNMEWIENQGSFFVESPINFVTALVWFLRKYQKGKYCTWAHVIELSQIPYKKLFTVLRAQPEIEVLMNPFVNALQHGANEQLEGQIASATVSLGKLSSPNLYYVLTGDDFTLDLNNPASPKIVTLGNNPQKTAVYGAILSVYINTINRLTNKKGMHPFSQVLDEFSTIIVNSIDKTVATGRSNKIAITVVVQDASQLKLAYSKEFADVIINVCGNVISGQVSGATAKLLSDRFGRTMQDRESIMTNSTDVNITHSKQLELVIPVSRIASLSAGEFVGLLADNPDQEMELKAFCSKIVNDHEALKREEENYKELPVVRKVSEAEVLENYMQVKRDVMNIIRSEMDRISDSPDLEHLILT